MQSLIVHFVNFIMFLWLDENQIVSDKDPFVMCIHVDDFSPDED